MTKIIVFDYYYISRIVLVGCQFRDLKRKKKGFQISNRDYDTNIVQIASKNISDNQSFQKGHICFTFLGSI